MITIPLKDMEHLTRRSLDIRVCRNNNFKLIGNVIAHCIKKLEEQPDLSVENALTEAILNQAHGDPKIAAQLGLKCGEYIDLLPQGPRARYIYLNIVRVDDGKPGPSFQEARELQQELAAILGSERVNVCGSIEGEKLRDLDDSVMRSASEVRAAIKNL